jgi:hypothetical protein
MLLKVIRRGSALCQEAVMSHSSGEHHGWAAYHHESATRHHRAAENAYGSGDHKTAAREAQCASDHACRAKHHADLAEKIQVQHHGMDHVEAVATQV